MSRFWLLRGDYLPIMSVDENIMIMFVLHIHIGIIYIYRHFFLVLNVAMQNMFPINQPTVI